MGTNESIFCGVLYSVKYLNSKNKEIDRETIYEILSSEFKWTVDQIYYWMYFYNVYNL